jgi:hypothetical protein
MCGVDVCCNVYVYSYIYMEHLVYTVPVHSMVMEA